MLNGYELGGGSHPDPRERPPGRRCSRCSASAARNRQSKFGHILDAFRFGAPPHGGLALGLDRIVMLVCGEDSIREVIAFPKNNKGADLMADSPAEVDFKQLRDLYLKSTFKEKKPEADGAS